MPDNGGVYLVPAFAGLGAPHWDAYARGAMFGLTRGATSAHIARAALEAIAFQNVDVLAAMQKDAGITLTELRVDGGATANNLLMQIQADILGVPVVRPRVLETTALGAGYLAGLAVGYWQDAADVAANWRVDRVFEPAMARDRALECPPAGTRRSSAPRAGPDRPSGGLDCHPTAAADTLARQPAMTSTPLATTGARPPSCSSRRASS